MPKEIILYNLREDVTDEDYKKWCEEYKGPTLLKLNSSKSFTLVKMLGGIKGNGQIGAAPQETKSPYKYIGIMDLSSLEDWKKDTTTTAFKDEFFPQWFSKWVAEFYVLGGEEGIGRGSEVFHQMMIPERMTTAAGAVGMGRSAIEIAAHYADRRRAFGKKIRAFEGVSFKVAESLTLLDAARALNHAVGKSIDAGGSPGKIRRLVSEAKKFSTDSAWTVVNHAMQILGGIGYTNVFPVERLLRDVRLLTIWTGTNEIMNLIIQHEFYQEFLEKSPTGRDVVMDAEGADLDGEKIYGDEDL